ncbi:MAG: rRNA adenine N-6-methyltransferase family protein [Candidatus Woesearchaeota archaeon]
MNLDQTGQHYMIDKELIQFIVNYGELRKDDVVLEIGCGHGALTRELVKKCKVVAIDIEKTILDIHSNQLTLVQGNVLEEIDQLRKKHDFNKIIANIPFSISEPLLRKMLKTDFDLAILTVGKSFAELLTKKDNRLGILANNFYEVEILQTIRPSAFFPQPRVNSAVIRLSPLALDDLDRKAVIYRKLLFLDDKKLKNALETILKDKTKKEIAALCKSEFYKKKLFQLTNEEFMELDSDLTKLL